MIGRKELEYPEGVSMPVVSMDGKILAYSALHDGNSLMVVGDKKGPEFDQLTFPVISARNGVVAYGAMDEKDQWHLVVGERKTPVSSRVVSVFLNEEGTAAGFVRGIKRANGIGYRLRVVVDGKEGEEYDGIESPSLSNDGKTAIYFVPTTTVRGEANGRLVIGERKIEVSGLVEAPVLSSDGKSVGYGVKVGRELWWRVVKLQ